MSEWFYKKISWFAGCLAIAALFGLVVFAANIEIKDVDLWLHLAAGRHILQNFSIPKVDFLSCTIANMPWINHEWLFQTIVYSVYNNAGIEGLIDLRVAVVFLTFVLLLFLGYTRERQFGVIATLLLVLLVYQMRLTLRPDLFSLLFFVLYISVLGAHLDKRWSLWVIILMQIVWTNMHGFFILGPLAIFISLISEWIKRRAQLPFEWNKTGRLSDGEYRRLKLMLPLAVFACLINPYFIEGAWYPIKVLFSLGGESKVFFSQIHELQRPFNWNNVLSWHPHFYYRVLFLVSLVSFVLNRRKIDINVLLLWLVFFLFSLSAMRNVVFFALAAYFAFLANWQYLSVREFLPARYDHIKFQTICSTVFKAILIMWIVQYSGQMMLNGYYDFDRFERKSEYGGLSQRNFPRQAVDFLIENDIKGNFFNDFNSGAYLLGRTAPDIKVFMDGRTEVYGVEFYKKHNKMWQGDAELFDEAVRRYHLAGAFLNSVYVPAPAKLIRHLYEHKDWVLVYFDYDATIFLRDIPENRRWINLHRINIAQRKTKDADLLKIGTYKVAPYRHVNRAYALFNMGFPEKARQEAAEALRIEPYNVKAHKLIGRIHNDREEFTEAFESLRKAKLLDPGDIKVRYQIAVALYHLGEVDKAEEQCRRVLAKKPKDTKTRLLLSMIHVKGQRYDEAMDILRPTYSKAIDELEGLLKVGDLLARQKVFHHAEEVYTAALKADPDNTTIKKKLNRIRR